MERVRESETDWGAEAYYALFDAAPDAVVIVRDGVIVDVNLSAQELFAYERDELVGAPVELLVPDSLRQKHAVHRDHFAEAPSPRRMGLHVGDLRARRSDGTTLPVDVSLSPLNGTPGLVAATVRDITDRLRAETRFQRVFHSNPIAMALIGADGRFTDVNPAFGRLLEGTPAMFVGKGFADLRPAEDVRRDDDLTAQLLAGELSGFSIEKRYASRRGRVVWVDLTVAPMPGDGVEAVAMLQDITERKASEARLLHTATHDQLTGVANRAMLTDHLHQSLARSRRSGEHVAALFIDLDHLKEVNDSLGHAAGDAVLVTVAGRIEKGIRPSDTVGRLGGDEFVVCCDGLDTDPSAALAEAVTLAERLREAIGAPISMEGSGTAETTASIGIAVADGRVAHSELLQAADRLMYEAKTAGRNACRWQVLAVAPIP